MKSVDSSFMRRSRRERILTLVVMGALLISYCLHLSAVSRTAVDIPEMDEWVVFLASSTRLTDGPTLQWLFHRHNEHYIVLPIFQGLFFYHLDRWNLADQQVFNFLLFGVLLVLIIHLGRRLCPEAPPWAVPAFALFLLSPLGYRNHSWAIQSHVHFVLIFFILATVALFSTRQRGPVLALGLLALTLACFSQAAGVAAALPLLGAYLAFKTVRVLDAPDRRSRTREILQGLLIVLGAVGILGIWMLGFDRAPQATPLAPPWSREFWILLLNLVSFGFGFERRTSELGLFLLLLVVTPIVGMLIRHRGRPPAEEATVGVIVLGFLAILSSIATGRGSPQVSAATAVASKYFHFAVVLLPFTYLAWHRFLGRPTRGKAFVCLALWILPAIGFADDLSFDAYRQTQKERLALEQSVLQYYHGIGPVPVPPRLPKQRPVELYLKNAQKLGVSFALRLGLPEGSPGGPLAGFDRPLRPIGRLDVMQPDGTVCGWAVSPRQPRRPLRVLLTAGGREAEALTGIPRRDVNSALGVPGDHGFCMRLPSVRLPANGIEPGQALEGRVVDPVDRSEHPLPEGAPLSPPPGWLDRPLGFLNGVDAGGALVGWALDPADPSRPLRVRFFVDGPGPGHGGILLGSALADRPRLDVSRITAKEGDHGFRFPIPALRQREKVRRIYGIGVRADGRPFPLSNNGIEIPDR